MKTKQLFWGFVLISLGFLSLSARYDWVSINYENVKDLWPVIFILGGLSVIFKESKLKSFFSIMLGISVSFILFAFIYDFNSDESWEAEFEDFDSQISALYQDDYKLAKLTINGGVGEFIIDGTTDELYEAIPQGIFENYDVEVDAEDNKVEVTFDLDDDIDLFNKNNKNKLHLKLNEMPVWNLELNLGAARSFFNLEEFKVRKMKLSTGAADTEILLGDKYKRTDVKIAMGAAAVELKIPKEAGCRVISSSLLVVNHLPGFEKKADGKYETPNFEEATQKIFVDIEGGLANFRIIKY